MDKLKLMASFIAVVEAGTFTAAAKQLGKTKALISRHIEQLETSLSVQLISRSTRSLHLTPTGRAYYEQAKRVLDEIESVESNLRQQHQSLTGRLRLSTPTTFGEVVLTPFFAEILEQHPSLEFDVLLNDRFVDIVAEGFDAAIRIGQLDDSNLVARKVGTAQLKLCVSPDFIEQYGVPNNPKDLTQLPCIVDRNFKQQGVWHFQGGEQVKVMAKISINSAMAAARAAALGSGVTLSPDFAVEEFIAEGQLITVLDDYAPESLPIHVVYPHRKHLSPKIKLLTETLVEYLQQR